MPLNLVCLRHEGGDAFNDRLLAALNASGELLLTHTRLNSRFVLRLAIGGTWTGRCHVEQAWAAIRATAAKLLQGA